MNDNFNPETSLEIGRRHLFLALQAIHRFNGEMSHSPVKLDINVLNQMTEDFYLASAVVGTIMRRAVKHSM